MKFVLFVVAILVLLWLVKGAIGRRAPPPERRHDTARDPSAGPLPMVTCAVCGLHLPRNESLPGRGGVFCGEAHRAEYERAHPPT
jgi:uncharacterized protein